MFGAGGSGKSAMLSITAYNSLNLWLKAGSFAIHRLIASPVGRISEVV